jgi:hypothetical protein
LVARIVGSERAADDESEIQDGCGSFFDFWWRAAVLPEALRYVSGVDGKASPPPIASILS